MGASIGRSIIIFAYAIIIFLMVRPRSQGPKLVTNSGNAIAKVITAGTGGGTW